MNLLDIIVEVLREESNNLDESHEYRKSVMKISEKLLIRVKDESRKNTLDTFIPTSSQYSPIGGKKP